MFLSFVLYDYLLFSSIGLEAVGTWMNYYSYIMSLGSYVCLFILFSGAREARNIVLEPWFSIVAIPNKLLDSTNFVQYCL